jgi:hypothetical protein
LLEAYVQGQLSNLHRKNVEAIALQEGVASRTLQRFLESIKWGDQLLRDRFQEELDKQQYDQRRNRQARDSYTKPRLARPRRLGIHVDQIKSCLPNRDSP